MTAGATKGMEEGQPVIIGWCGLRAGLLAAGFMLATGVSAQIAETTDRNPQAGTAPAALSAKAPAQADPAAGLALKRDSTRSELEALSKTITLSHDRTAELEAGIADLEKTSESLRAAILESAGNRRALEQKIVDGEEKLITLRTREDAVRNALGARRGVLAEVLAALQRMGRNPPPALLVTPEDALASVRSAILLGAVIPGMRHETENLVADLKALSGLRKDIATQKQALGDVMASRLEEERRMNMLIAEKQKLKQRSASELATERRKAEQLAAQAISLEGLIGSIETEIASVRDAAAAARADEEKRRLMSETQRASEPANSVTPDKNRIAPAYAFSDLHKKLAYPVAGSILRRFGDADGTGHSLQGMMLETNAGALVTAPADGWIIFAGAFRSYGRMIILNPGDGYHVVLSGLDDVTVQQGQFVVAGEPLGTMGNKRVVSATALTLETARPTLYIEFRKNGKSVDSRPWWTAADTGKARNDS